MGGRHYVVLKVSNLLLVLRGREEVADGILGGKCNPQIQLQFSSDYYLHQHTVYTHIHSTNHDRGEMSNRGFELDQKKSKDIRK
jgi:hypothetical protein